MLLAAASFNHLLAQNAWAQQRLAPLAGKSFAVHAAPLPALTFTIQHDGQVQDAASGVQADATLSAAPDTLLRYLSQEPRDTSLLHITGDSQFGAEISDVFAHLSWEAEEDLSRVVGDVLAHRMAGLARGLWTWQKQSALNVTAAASEYFTEERPLIAKRMHIEQFARDVDTVRLAVDRLELRIQKLNNRA